MNDDTKKFAAAVMQGTKGCSPALECKRLLEFEGTTGKKSNRKNNKRENRRAIDRMHYWVRGGSEQLNGIKCKPANLPKGEKIRDHYHMNCCPELGLGTISLRKIPCKCVLLATTRSRRNGFTTRLLKNNQDCSWQMIANTPR